MALYYYRGYALSFSYVHCRLVISRVQEQPVSWRLAAIHWRAKQNDKHFADDIVRYVCIYESCCTLINISLSSVHNGTICNKLVLFYVMARYPTHHEPLTELMVTKNLCHMTPSIRNGLNGNRKYVWAKSASCDINIPGPLYILKPYCRGPFSSM